MSRDQHRGWLPEFILNAIALLFAFAMVAQPYVIPTGSMENTLLVGDHLIVDKLAYAPASGLGAHLLPYEPVRRGDIAVFRFPPDIGQTFVKRIVAVPGDRIRIVNKQVYVNGAPLDEPYKVHKSPSVEPYRDNFPAAPQGPVAEEGFAMLRHNVQNGEVVVPPGHYFAMGDNRDDSLDSRYWGFIPRENIIGRPLLVFWSYDAPSSDLQDNTPRLDHIADVALHFFTRTRWNRTFRLVRSDPRA
jgi:signal peptidase I